MCGGVFLKCTVVSWPNLDWQQTADFPTVSAICLFGADTCREIKRSEEYEGVREVHEEKALFKE